MHITLSVIGRLRDTHLKALYEEYKKRIEWKITLHEFEAKSSPQQESVLLLDALPPSSFLISLDEEGENIQSKQLANLLKDIQLYHQGRAAFVIGGADGLSKELKAKAQKSLAFGAQTWPHLMVRIMLMEQLYRAQQILKNHPYHRG